MYRPHPHCIETIKNFVCIIPSAGKTQSPCLTRLMGTTQFQKSLYTIQNTNNRSQQSRIVSSCYSKLGYYYAKPKQTVYYTWWQLKLTQNKQIHHQARHTKTHIYTYNNGGRKICLTRKVLALLRRSRVTQIANIHRLKYMQFRIRLIMCEP